MKRYLYETHLHTSPVSKCARSTVKEMLEFYKELGYDGIFITNHFLDGNLNYDKSAPYEEQIEFYFSDYEQAVLLSKEIGIKVFLGVESSYKGTDFLIYGLDKTWFLNHPEIITLKKSESLSIMAEHGALIIQAHPYREARHIDHIRLFPRHVHGVEIYNGNCCSTLENAMAKYYANQYNLIEFAGTDIHAVSKTKILYGMQSKTPISCELDFINNVKSGELTPFCSSDLIE